MVSSRHPLTIDNLPREVLSEIFIRLLAKQLAQMRCVCKPWNALLSHSSFVKSHLSHSIQNNDEILFFFDRESSFHRSPITTRPSRSPNLELTNFLKLPVNPQPKNTRFIVIGSVNGLICFCYGSSHDDYIVGIWNPSLSAVLTLPPCLLPSQNSRKIHLRFGYDPKTDDYKVVKLTSLLGPYKMVLQGEVYSMRKGSWKLISQMFPSHIAWIQDQDANCVDGHDGNLHWLGCTCFGGVQLVIVAFDLVEETFCDIRLPDPIQREYGPRFNLLGVLAGKVCIMSKIFGGGFEVWVMDEYGVAESWVKHHVLSQFSGSIRPYGFTLHSEFLLRAGACFGLYDPVAAKTKTFKIMGGQFDITTKVVNYVDSLVWVAPA